MALIEIILLIILTYSTAANQIYQINLDDPPHSRYTSVSKIKKQSIKNFISYLKNNVTKYKFAFSTAQTLYKISPKLLRTRVGTEFYDECLSISVGAQIPVSEIIVFNYMYELGAATKFCTAITLSMKNKRILGRNLDYGFQQYLAHNSLHFQYLKKGQIQFQTLGHAGFVGTHTALKRQTQNDYNSYAITLNERIDGGLHKTMKKIFIQKCQTSPYSTMKALKYAHGDINQVYRYLDGINTCSAVYWTMISKNGGSYVIQKNRGIGSHYLRQSSYENGINYIIQTNHDYDTQDPDGRSTAANAKIHKIINSQNSTQTLTNDQIWKILTQQPNFNQLTLMTSLIDVQNAKIKYEIWNFTKY